MRNELTVLSDYVRGESGYTGALDPDVDLLESRILDSFSIVQLAMFVQQRFDVELEAEDLTRANLGTLNSVLALIDKYKAGAAG